MGKGQFWSISVFLWIRVLMSYKTLQHLAGSPDIVSCSLHLAPFAREYPSLSETRGFIFHLAITFAQSESGELSFIWGKMRTAAWKIAPQIAQIDCSKEAVPCLVSQSCLPLCNMGCSPPGSSVHGILQARILEWIAMPSFRGSF